MFSSKCSSRYSCISSSTCSNRCSSKYRSTCSSNSSTAMAQQQLLSPHQTLRQQLQPMKQRLPGTSSSSSSSNSTCNSSSSSSRASPPSPTASLLLRCLLSSVRRQLLLLRLQAVYSASLAALFPAALQQQTLCIYPRQLAANEDRKQEMHAAAAAKGQP